MHKRLTTKNPNILCTLYGVRLYPIPDIQRTLHIQTFVWDSVPHINRLAARLTPKTVWEPSLVQTGIYGLLNNPIFTLRNSVLVWLVGCSSGMYNTLTSEKFLKWVTRVLTTTIAMEKFYCLTLLGLDIGDQLSNFWVCVRLLAQKLDKSGARLIVDKKYKIALPAGCLNRHRPTHVWPKFIGHLQYPFGCGATLKWTPMHFPKNTPMTGS